MAMATQTWQSSDVVQEEETTNLSRGPTSVAMVSISPDDGLEFDTPDSSADAPGSTAGISCVDDSIMNLAPYEKDIGCRLLRQPAMYGRLFILVLDLILLMLSIFYCLGQRFTFSLDLITECEGREIEEIWRHSFESATLVAGQVQMTAESQYGHTSDACYTTNSIETNTEALWHSNQYKYAWTDRVTAQFVLFLLIALVCVAVLVYNMVTICIDVRLISRGQIHETSQKYEKYELPHMSMSKERSVETCSKLVAWKLQTCWTRHLGDDTSGWIIRGVASEVLELFIQTQALLLYNGYRSSRSNPDLEHHEVFLANKPHFIILFACILAFNCVGSGGLWMSYACANKRCHGLPFKASIFFVDQCSDLFYTVFPFYVIIADDYNQDASFWVLLAQLNTTSFLAFISAFVPLFFLCAKSLLIIRASSKELRNDYYKKWKIMQKQAMTQQKSTGMFDDSAGKSFTPMKFFKRRTVSNHGWIEDTHNVQMKKGKQCALCGIAVLYIVYGIVVLSLVIRHVKYYEAFCDSVDEQNFVGDDGGSMSNISLSSEQRQLLEDNPELFYWHKCLYKVYPFALRNNQESPCQCRVAVIDDWRELATTPQQRATHFNLTQHKMLGGMLTRWYMLQKFKSYYYDSDFSDTFDITNDMFNAVEMRAFELGFIATGAFERGIGNWKKLEYLKMENTEGNSGSRKSFPSDFGELSEMKYIAMIRNGLSEIPASICELKQLQILEILWNPTIGSIPHCVGDLAQLKAIYVDGCFLLTDVPFSIFNLPHLQTLSLFKGSISFDSLLYYNLPSNVSINDTEAVAQWVDETFIVRNLEQTYYSLALNPICDEIEKLPDAMQSLVNQTCEYFCEITALYTQFCPPRVFGDGRCDEGCNLLECVMDGGDCVQLCFAEELANCSLDKLTNGVCDDGCDNEYCSAYLWASDFSVPKAEPCPFNTSQLCAADSQTCVLAVNESDVILDTYNITCQESAPFSIYLDSNIASSAYDTCQQSWVGDGQCDDSCRTEQCSYDAGDCDLGCIDDQCKTIYDFWTLLLQLSGVSGAHKVEHTTACVNGWPVAAQALDVDEGVVCADLLGEADFNRDQYLNFQEFVTVTYKLASPEDGGYLDKGAQVNCSSCVGVENYNI